MTLFLSFKSILNRQFFVLFALVSTILFQITTFKFIWGLESLAILVNTFLLLVFSSYFIISFINKTYDSRTLIFYVAPGLLVYISYSLKILYFSFSNSVFLNQLGSVIPWAVYLAIPGLLKSNSISPRLLWRCYHNLLFAIILFSLIEHFSLFLGFVPENSVITHGGPFLAGYGTIFYEVNGDVHYRFYSAFQEPGTLAMFLLPAMAYAYVNDKYLSLLVFSIALFMTDSLGGFIGLAILAPLLIYVKFKRFGNMVFVLAFTMVVVMVFCFFDYFALQYEAKGLSASEREASVVGFLKNLPSLLVLYPFGLPLFESSEEALRNPFVTGLNFSIALAYFKGGIFGMLGYVIALALSATFAVSTLLRKKIQIEEAVVAVSIIPLLTFVFQRSTMWESCVFALLYSPFLIVFLQRKNMQTCRSNSIEG
jgi:hypothetical protein